MLTRKATVYSKGRPKRLKLKRKNSTSNSYNKNVPLYNQPLQATFYTLAVVSTLYLKAFTEFSPSSSLVDSRK